MWYQQQVHLSPYKRGFHLITADIQSALAPHLGKLNVGILHLFLQHTSASLTINENSDPLVRQDLKQALSRIAPEGSLYAHDQEGPDDMPAHIKSSLLGVSLHIPIHQGQLALGTWQGIYLGEHRERAHSRRILCTLYGE